MEPRFFKTPADFRLWLQAHADTETELLVGFYKTGEVIPLQITERNGILNQPVEMFKLEKTL